MKKVNKIIIGFFVVALVIIATLYGVYISKLNNSAPTNEDVFYYGITCPHCKIVEEFIAKNNVSAKIEFKSKEVYENAANAQELIKVAKYCKLEKDYIGAVPLLFYNQSCYLGDSPIIEFLNKTMENQ